MKTQVGIIALFAASTFSAFCAEPPPAPAPEVKKIVLYKHGMGYFERQGKVNGNATVTLAFKAEQMKDLLTSFFVLDENGGKVNAVLYDTKDPLSKQLEGIQINVPENSALSQFLTQLKGAKISVSVAGDKVIGRIMGVEPITETKDGQVVHHSFKLVLLTDAGPIRSVDLYSVGELSLQDPALQHDLERLLAITLDAKYTDRKSVSIQAVGDGERLLRIGYLVEQPIWKASYRLLLDKGKGDALLQGWALSENNTEDDWKDVDISFVAGNPLSYIMDLYSPYYPQRPTVPIPGLTGLAVNWGAAPDPSAINNLRAAAAPGAPFNQNRELALDEGGDGKEYAKRDAQRARRAVGGGGGARNEDQAAAKPMAELAERSMAAMATGQKVGELFSYQSKEKVSIPRGKAAMVPIISQKMKGERVVFYKAAFSPKPVDAYILKNETDLTLEAGALTFFEEGTSLGSGILSHVLVNGAKEIIPYALDAAVSVTPSINQDSQPAYKGNVANGVLTLTSVESVTSTWKLANKGKEEKTVIFDQPMNGAYKLVEPVKAEEEVEGHYRFRVTLKAGESSEFKVVEKRDVSQTVYLANINEDQIRFYARQAFFSEKAKVFFAELAALQVQRADLLRQVQGMNAQVQRISEEENRLRENLKTLRQTPKEEELRAKWVKSLSDDEDKIVALRTQLDEITAKQKTLDEQLAKKVQEYRGE